MLKKFTFSLILSVFILGIAIIAPKSLSEYPTYQKHSFFNFLDTKEQKDTTIILTGDIMLGRSVMNTSLSKGDPTYPFQKVAGELNKASLVFGNLENPITDGCPTTTTGMIFCASPQMLLGLKYAGVDIVNLANNHTQNYGGEGFAQTKDFLTKEGVSFVGDGNLVIKEVDGIKFGFLGFNFVDIRPQDSDYQLIRDSKSKVDVLIVMVHWGNEYLSDPSESQKEIADNLIKNGGDVIAGGHPHWVQGVDTINGKPIFYSLGNFVFDQGWSEETKKGMAVRLTYQKDKLTKIEEMPVYMESFAQPNWVKN